MTDEQYEEFQRATDPLKPLATTGHFAGIDGVVAGVAALAVYAISGAMNLPEVAAFGLGVAAAFFAGRSVGNEKWAKYNRACEGHLDALRRAGDR